MLIIFYTHSDKIGGGDVKYIMISSLIINPEYIGLYFLLIGILGVLCSIYHQKTKIPLGIAISIANLTICILN